MKHIFFIAAMIFVSAGYSFAQAVKVPENYEFESQEDFTKYQSYVMPIVNWLEKNPVMAEDPTYKKASAFLVEWSTGSEKVNMEYNANIIRFAELAPDLLLYFTTAWTRYELQHPIKGETPEMNERIRNNTAAVEGVIAYYKSQADMPQNEQLDMLHSLKEKGQLEGWVKKQLEE